MNVVSYARVSTIRQESEGESLANQERAFQTWLKQNRAQRVRAYAETKSAKSIEGREEFSRMIAELPTLKPELIIVDTIDRFSRNLHDGLGLLEQFKGHGVKLLPLEWSNPVNLDDDRDWKSVVGELTAAEGERRRIRTRVIRSYQGRRERGATTHSRPPLGLLKDGDRLVQNAAILPVMQEVERMYISGATLDECLAYTQANVEKCTWTSRNGPRRFLLSPEYVKAGARSKEMQERIDALVAIGKQRFGQERLYVHPFSGVYACGACVDGGRTPETSLMCGNSTPRDQRAWGKTNPGARVICQARNGRPHASNIGVKEDILDLIFAEILRGLNADAVLLTTWEASERAAVDSSPERLVQKRLDAIDAKAEKVKARRAKAFDLLTDDDPIIAAQAKKMLTDVALDELKFADEREATLRELAAAVAPRKARTAVDLQPLFAEAANLWPNFSNQQKNDAARALCASLGSYPRLYRGTERHPVEVAVVWPEIMPGTLLRVHYGKGITAKVETVTILKKAAKKKLPPAGVTAIGLAR